MAPGDPIPTYVIASPLSLSEIGMTPEAQHALLQTVADYIVSGHSPSSRGVFDILYHAIFSHLELLSPPIAPVENNPIPQDLPSAAIGPQGATPSEDVDG